MTIAERKALEDKVRNKRATDSKSTPASSFRLQKEAEVRAKLNQQTAAINPANMSTASISRLPENAAAAAIQKKATPKALVLPAVKPVSIVPSLRLPESAAAVAIQKKVAQTTAARTAVPTVKTNPTADMNVLQKIDYYKNKYNPLALGDMAINQAGAGAAQFGAATVDAVTAPFKGQGVNYPKAQSTADLWSNKPAVPTTPVTKYINNARETLSLARKARQNYYLSGNTVQDKSDAYSAKIADKYADLTDNDVTKALSDLASSAGYMIPVAVTNMIIPSSGTALLFAAGYSSGERQALKAGGTAAEASAYAYLNGLNQSAGEMLVGGVLGKGAGAIDTMLKKVGVDLTSKIANPTIKAWANYAVSILGEGAEEVVQGVADIAMQRGTYNPAAKLNPKDLAYQGLLGGGLGGVFGAGKFISGIKTGLTLPSVNAPAQTITDAPQSTITPPLQLPHVEQNAVQGKPTPVQTFADRNAADVTAIANKLQTGLRDGAGDETLTRYNAAKNETERTGAIYSADVESVNTASKISAAGGLDIRYYRQEASGGTLQNGFTKNGVLYLNAASKQAAPQIIAHELTHNLENAKAYTALSKFVMQKLDPQTLTQMRTDTVNLYKTVDPNFTPDDADREIVSQYAESKLFTDEAAVMEVVRSDRSLGEKIHTWLSDMVTKLTGTAEEKYLLRAKELYGKALAQTRAADTVQAKAAAASVSEVNNDIEYTDAVNQDDTDMAQKMVDEAANEWTKGYTLLKGFHGSKVTAEEFGNYIDDVLYITEDKQLAGTYGDNIKRFYIKSEAPLTLDAEGHNWNDLTKSEDIKSWLSEVNSYDTDLAESLGVDYEISTTRFIEQLASGQGQHDSVIIKNVVDSADLKKYAKPVTIAMVFGDAQVKSADPITYDDNGKVIPLSKRFGNTNKDIRYSITPDTRTATNTSEDVTAAKLERATVKQLEADNKKLKELNDYQRKQVQRTTTIEPNVYAVTAYVRQLRKGYDSKTPVSKLTGKMAALFTYVANGDEGGGVDWNVLYDTARDIAGDIISGSEVLVNGSEMEQYSDIKKYMKAKTFYVAAEKKSDLGDYAAFRKHNFGRFKLTTDIEGGGHGVDTSYAEMTELYGEGLFPSEIINQTDQLMQVSNVLDGMGAVYENPYSGKVYDEASAFIANDILDKFYDIPQATPTFAEKADKTLTLQKVNDQKKIDKLRDAKNARIEKIRQEAKNNMAKKLLEARKVRDEKIDALKKQTQERTMKAQQGRSDTDIRRRLKRSCFKMAKMLATPDKTSHIPDELKASVADLFNMIEFSPDEIIQDGENKGQKKSDILKKRLESVAESYRRILENKDDVKLTADPDIQTMFDEARDTLAHKSIRQLKGDELQNLYKLTKAVYKSIMTANMAFVDAKKRTYDEIAQGVRDENKDKKQRLQAKFGTFKRAADNMMNFSMIDPRTLFKRLGKTMQGLYMNIERGQDTYINTVTKTVDYMNNVLKGIDTSKWDGDNATLINVGIGGAFDPKDIQTIQMSPAMLIDLYLANGREQARKHIYGVAGIALQLPSLDKPLKPMYVTEDDVKSILSHMTPEMIKAADAMGKYLTTEMSALGNEVALDLYGYSKFTEANYWPIKVHSGSITQSYGETQVDPKLVNMGMTKTVQAMASNALIIRSGLDVFDKHTTQMAAYNAYVKPLADMERVLNNKDFDGTTVMSVLSDAYGEDAEKYIRNFMRLVNTAKLSNNLWNDQLSKKMLRNFKAASVGLNASVVLKQPVSYIRAAAQINPKYLMQALNFESRAKRKANMAEMLKYNPVARIKSWGYADMGFGKNQRQLYDASAMTTSDKIAEISGALPSKADEITWGRIWAAIKLEQEAKGVYDLSKAAERFREVISSTQVVNTIFDTPAILNEDSTLTKMVTAFMGEPLKTYNAMYDAVQSGDKRQIKRTAGALLVNSFAVALITTAFSHLRSKDDEKETTALNLTGEIGMNMLQDTAGIIPYLRDVTSMFEGYDVTRTDLTGAAKMVKALLSLGSDTVKVLQGGEATGTILSHLKDITTGISYILGVPANNVWRDFEGVIRKFAQTTDSAGLEYLITVSLYNPANTGNRTYYYNMLSKYQDDEDVYAALKEKLINDYGYTVEGIDSGIRSRIKDSDEYITAYEAVSGRATAGIEDNKWYLTLPKAEQKEVMSKAESYATATALAKVDSTYKVSGASKSIGEAVADGLTAGEYLLFTAAKRKIDAAGDNNGSYNVKETVSALRELDWMSDRKRELLFTNAYENRADDMEAILGAGLSFNQFLTVYDKYSIVDNKDLSASNQALEMAKWADDSFTSEQSAIIQEYMGYGNYIPTSAVAYNKFTDAGIDYDAAYTLADSINALEPVDGKEMVSNLQKYRAVVDSVLTEKDKIRAMSTLMSEKGYLNLRKATLKGLKLSKYITYLEGTQDLVSDTEDGNAISGSLKQKTLTYINHMLLTTKDKDTLYLLAGYSEDTLWEAQWNSGYEDYDGDITLRKNNGLILRPLKKKS